ncbi:MAG: YdcF family protein [Chloroflexi bacterium]|nr:YdcF family protein [Chloroflexota bacterium]
MYPRVGCALQLLAFLIAVPVIAALTSSLWLPALGHALEAPSDPAPADAIAVFSGGRQRLRQAVALYRQGLAPELWHTGDAPQGEEPFERSSQLARQAAIDMGVPPDAIHLLPSTSTWEDAQQIAALARQRGIHSILLVTSWYHGRRGLCVMRRHLDGTGIRVTFQAASNVTFGPDNWWRNEEGFMDVVNEYIKFGFYWLHYGLAPWQC